MSDEKVKKILERIRKLLAMAGDASSPHEAAIAAKRAKALLNEHNLSEADVIAGGMTLDDFQTRDVGEARRRFPKWISILSPAIATYTGTSAVFHLVDLGPKSARGKQVRYRGHVDDLTLAEYLHVYLVRTVENMTQAAGLKGLGPRNSFKCGMAQSIGEKLREMAAQEEEWFCQNSDSKALALADKKDAMIRQKFGETRYSCRATYLFDSDAQACGQDAGRDVNIYRGLAGTPKRQRCVRHHQ